MDQGDRVPEAEQASRLLYGESSVCLGVLIDGANEGNRKTSRADHGRHAGGDGQPTGDAWRNLARCWPKTARPVLRNAHSAIPKRDEPCADQPFRVTFSSNRLERTRGFGERSLVGARWHLLGYGEWTERRQYSPALTSQSGSRPSSHPRCSA